MLHIWAGLGFSEGNGYNSFTFNTYLAFFDYLGILTFILIFPLLEKHASAVSQIAASLAVLVFAAGIGYGGFEVFGDTLINLKIPRIKTFLTTGQILPGVPLWDFLSTKYGIPLNSARFHIPEVAGLIVGLIFLIAGIGIWKLLSQKKSAFYSYGLVVIMSFFLVGVILTPTPILGAGFTQWNCTGNVISDYETIGRSLAQNIPPGSQVYWDGDNAVAILLYIPGISIYPQQVDGIWNYYHGGDSNALARLGSWNDELALKWRGSADAILFQQTGYPAWQAYINTSKFDEINNFLKIPLNCEPETFLRIFIQKK